MSLKAFHVLFIALSTLLCIGLAWWSAEQYSAFGNGGRVALLLLGAAGSVGLPAYGWWFLRKMRHVGYL
jgi:hypothetical protein